MNMKSSTNDLTNYYHSIKTFKVGQELFKQRCNRLLKRQPLTPVLLKEAATLKPDAYFAKHAGRRTRMNINGQSIDVMDEFDKIGNPAVLYPAFRSRLTTFSKKQQKMSLKAHTDVFNKASLLTEEHWKYFIGGGCAKPFIYDGSMFHAIKGQQFLSVPSFLMKVGKLDIKPLVLGRLKQSSKKCLKKCSELGSELDRAISEEKHTPKDGYGRIYKVYSTELDQVYIGLTTFTLGERFNMHKSSARKDTGSLFHQTMKRYGIETFSICLIEDHVPISEVAEREIYNIKLLNTLSPHGLNSIAGGQLGGCKGTATTVNEATYKSLAAAGRAIERETNGAVRASSAIRRIHSKEDIYAHTRRNSLHVDAGTNLFRRHLGLVKRKQICRRWLDYDLFKLDVLKEFTIMEIVNKKLRLGKIKGSRLYGPKSFLWFTSRKAIEARCGKPINAFGQSFPSITAFAKHYGKPVSTVKHRMRVLRFTPEQAVKTM
jgi:hypothetical protein